MVVLSSDPLPGRREPRGHLGFLVALLGLICLAAFVLLLLTGGALLAAL